ncbi:hypothetical protein [Anaeromusa sp.]|uniref:hypothetical protein n=1 Tax=Anaeromusa sp. TaxID=1872520 RepID=UPI0026186151|nr:hypothetical protein [Anaeromusa sp.]MDD3157035.1 hypothetical protein [Anaeromusa sp.]
MRNQLAGQLYGGSALDDSYLQNRYGFTGNEQLVQNNGRYYVQSSGQPTQVWVNDGTGENGAGGHYETQNTGSGMREISGDELAKYNDAVAARNQTGEIAQTRALRDQADQGYQNMMWDLGGTSNQIDNYAQGLAQQYQNSNADMRSNYNGLYQGFADTTGDTRQNFDALRDSVNQGTSNFNTASGALTGDYNTLRSNIASTPTAYNTAANAISGQSNQMEQTANTGLSGLINGQLPTSFSDNYQTALNTAANRALGQSVNSLTQAGVLDSTSADQATRNIADSVANTAATNYNNNLNTVASLYGQQANVANQNIQNQAGLAQNQFTNNLNAQTQGLSALNSQTDNLRQNQATNLSGQNLSNTVLNSTYDNARNNATTGTNIANSFYNANNAANQTLNSLYNTWSGAANTNNAQQLAANSDAQTILANRTNAARDFYNQDQNRRYSLESTPVVQQGSSGLLGGVLGSWAGSKNGSSAISSIFGL